MTRRVMTAGTLVAAATIVAPWLPGSWAAGRWFALCVSPGAAVLLLLTPRIFRDPAPAVAGTVLASAVLSPATNFLFMRLLGGIDQAFLAHAILWGIVLAGALWLRAGSPPLARGNEASDVASDGASRESSHQGSCWEIAALAATTVLIALPLLINIEVRIRSDAWTHMGLVQKMLRDSYPWTDPRFAGQPLRYFWLYNFWAAGFAARAGTSIASALTLVNLTGLLAYVAAVFSVAKRFFSPGSHRVAALAVAAIGLNPFGFYGIVTHLARALIGEDRGAAELAAVIQALHFTDTDVIYTLTPHLTSYVSWIGKFLVITPFGVGMAGSVFISLMIWESAREGRIHGRMLVLIAAGFAAVVFHHLIAAAIIGVSLGGALLITRMIGRSPLSWRGTLLILAVMAVVAAASAPYYAGLLLGRDSSAGGYGFGIQQVWALTALTSIGPVILLLLLGRRSLRTSLGRAWPALVFFALISLLMILLVKMPTTNENKIIIIFFCVSAPFAAYGAVAVHRWAWPRLGRRVLWLAIVVGAFLVPALIWFGYLVHPPHERPAGLNEASRWLREETPPEAVLIEPVGLHLLMNRAERDMLVSDYVYILLGGYPLEDMQRRISLVEHLYASGEMSAQEVDLLRALQRPVYVYFHRDLGTREVSRSEPSASQFDLVFQSEDVEIYKLRMEAATTPHASPSDFSE